MSRWLCTFLLVSLCVPAAKAQEPAPRQPTWEEFQAMQERLETMEFELLKLQAEAPATAEETDLTPITFQGKSRSLQASNPEISFEVDAYAQWLYVDGQEYFGDDRSGFHIREGALNFQSPLDPFSVLKVTLAAVPEEGVFLEEAYIEYHSVLPRVSMAAGRFRQPFGIVNRWHEHGLDQFNYPLMLKVPFGDEGLAATGIGFTWLMPAWWASAQELVIQVTNSENADFLSGEFFSLPSGMGHLKNYWDLTRDSYLEWGFSGLVGPNNQRGFTDDSVDPPVLVDDPTRLSWAVATDLTLSWEPLHRASYRGVEWRTEFLLAEQDQGKGVTARAWGGYTALTVQAARNLYLSARGDYVRNDGFGGAVGEQTLWRATPGLTWWQSEFVRCRLEYSAGQTENEPLEHRVLFQLSFAAGPHKHERY